MRNGYTIRPFRDTDVDGFLSLYKRTFGEQRSEEWFDWKYRSSPYANHIPIVVTESDAGDIVGARAFFALKMHCDSTQPTCFQPADAMVHADYRRQGLFTAMTQEAIDRYSDSDVRIFLISQMTKHGRGARNSVGGRFLSALSITELLI
jgi:predicted N-acetyltransferase YhbS